MPTSICHKCHEKVIIPIDPQEIIDLSMQAVEKARDYYMQREKGVRVVEFDKLDRSTRAFHPSCDLIIEDVNGLKKPIYVEVKHTKNGIFQLTPNELKGLELLGNRYEIFVFSMMTGISHIFKGEQVKMLHVGSRFSLKNLHHLKSEELL